MEISAEQEKMLKDFFHALPQSIDCEVARKLAKSMMLLSLRDQLLAIDEMLWAVDLPRGVGGVPLAVRLGTFGNGLREISHIGAVVEFSLQSTSECIKFWELVVGKD